MLNFTIDGPPVPQPRHRAVAVGRHARVYLPDRHPIHAWKLQVRSAFQRARGTQLTGPVSVSADFFLSVRSGKLGAFDAEGGWSTSARGDVENLVKGLLDALNGIAWEDDRQVARLHARKLWSMKPRTVVAIEALL